MKIFELDNGSESCNVIAMSENLIFETVDGLKDYFADDFEDGLQEQIIIRELPDDEKLSIAFPNGESITHTAKEWATIYDHIPSIISQSVN